MNKVFKWCLLIVVLCVVIEGTSLIGLFIIKERMFGLTFDMILADKVAEIHKEAIGILLSGRRGRSVFYDPMLGWVQEPKGSVVSHASDSENRIRIAAFGDSFTKGSGIEMLASNSKNLEILNFGVGGYGFDQSYLRYLQEGPTFDFHVILIGFMTENCNRNLNVYRPFYFPIGRLACSKPRFTLVDGELRLIENPLREISQYQELLDNPKEMLERLGANDRYFNHRPKSSICDVSATVRLVKLVIWGLRHNHLIRAYIRNGFYNEQSEGFQITKRIFDKFHDAVVANGSLPLIILFPRKVDVLQHQKDGIRVYQPLTNYFDEKAYRYVDLLEAFDEQKAVHKTQDLFQPDGMHYNEKGNEIIRNYIYSYLAKNNFQ
jgi:hypothetical protein